MLRLVLSNQIRWEECGNMYLYCLYKSNSRENSRTSDCFIKAVTENMFEESSNLHRQALALKKMLFSFKNSFNLFCADHQFIKLSSLNKR